MVLYSQNPICVQVSRLILLAGGNPNVRTEFFNNAPLLCVAAREGFSDMVALLLEFGADVNATSDTGMSPLCYAAASGHREVMRMLCVRNSRVRIYWRWLFRTAWVFLSLLPLQYFFFFFFFCPVFLLLLFSVCVFRNMSLSCSMDMIQGALGSCHPFLGDKIISDMAKVPLVWCVSMGIFLHFKKLSYSVNLLILRVAIFCHSCWFCIEISMDLSSTLLNHLWAAIVVNAFSASEFCSCCQVCRCCSHNFLNVFQPSLQDKQGQCAAVHAAICGQLDSLAFLLQLEWRPHQGEPSRHDATLQCMASAAATGNRHVSVCQGVPSVAFAGLMQSCVRRGQTLIGTSIPEGFFVVGLLLLLFFGGVEELFLTPHCCHQNDSACS